jgi:sec-independent protein translocase protein TatC
MRKLFRTNWKIIIAPFHFIIWIVQSVNIIDKKVSHYITSYFKEEELDDTPIDETLTTTIENPSSHLPHINALRSHLYRALLAVIITTALSFLFVREILGYLANLMVGSIQDLVAIDVTENIGTGMRVTLLSDFTIALLYIIFEIWLLIATALKVCSRIIGLIATQAGLIFIVAGIDFAFFIMLPAAFPFLFNFMGLITQPHPPSYYNFVTSMLFWIGVTFEFPLVFYSLVNLGFVKAKSLVNKGLPLSLWLSSLLP